MTASELKTPFTIFGTPRCFSPNTKQDHRVEEEGDRSREQHRALLALASGG